MSDQGERGVRWTDTSESEPAGRPGEPDAGSATGPRVVSSEPKVPEVFVPAPHGRTEFSGAEEGSPHDVWGKVEGPAPERAPEPAAEPEPGFEPEPEPAAPQAAAGPLPDAEDVRVAPAPEPEQGQEPPGWEGSLFEDGPAGGGADEAPAVQVGLSGPARSGKPSSGNWQMPDWMADEAAADAKLGGSPGSAGSSGDVFDDGAGRSRLVLIGGVGLLVVALIAAGGVYYWTHRTDDVPAAPKNEAGPGGPAAQADEPQVTVPADKKLKRFAGKPGRIIGRLTDAASGLSYPRFAPPWQLPTKKNKLSTPGWSGQQILVTEKHGQRLWYGQFLTGTLPPTLLGSYKGPKSVKKATALAAQGFEAQYYAFPHKSAPLASQAFDVSGHKGWLIASYLTYKRAGFRATGEIVATAVIDTGRKTPATVFASLPNTHKKVWPDLNEFFGQLKVAS